MRKLLMAVAIGLGAGLAFVVPAVPATAAPVAASIDGVPASVLGECSDPGKVGGWGIRSFTSWGTNVDTDLEVRPRTIRLGEPCIDGNEIRVPSKITETPIVEWVDWECPGGEPVSGCGVAGGGGGGTGVGPGGSPGVLERDWEGDPVCNAAGTWCIELTAIFYSRWKPSAVWHAYTGMCFNRTVGTGTSPGGGEVVWFQFGADTRSTPANIAYAEGGWYYGGDLALQNTVSWGGAEYTPNPTACPSGSDLTMRVSVNNQGGPGSATGTEYDFRTAPAAFGIGTTAAGGPANEVLDPSPDGTTDARITVGGSVPFAAPSETTKIYCDNLNGASSPREIVGSRDYVIHTYLDDYTLPRVDGLDLKWDGDLDLRLGSPEFSTVEWSVAACPRIVRIDVVVCTFFGNGPDEYSCTITAWWWETWKNNHEYTDPDDPNVGNCEVVWIAPACTPIVYPPYVDPTDFGSVCGNPPAYVPPGWAEFGDWVPSLVGWIGSAIGYYADCLFNPRGGWDPAGVLPAAWSESSYGEVTTVLATAAESFTFGETCGALFEVEGGVLDGFGVNTCAWSEWAGPLRAFITLAVWILFGIWALWFVIQTITGVVNRKSPNPIDADAESAS